MAETTTDEDAAMDGTLSVAELERLQKDFSANPIEAILSGRAVRELGVARRLGLAQDSGPSAGIAIHRLPLVALLPFRPRQRHSAD